jgi:hypothetical protein
MDNGTYLLLGGALYNARTMTKEVVQVLGEDDQLSEYQRERIVEDAVQLGAAAAQVAVRAGGPKAAKMILGATEATLLDGFAEVAESVRASADAMTEAVTELKPRD